ncbi:sodium-coupled monocarboxylate transporter 1-like [Melanotaenia boesemani]|uniref:sodium-coupled monocarboxylate transporter 1-like n=1 Tax=Melanotaenia boesemani TaxID=1250792 RepID=UPI001C03DC1B|nr:sodium-coupled monocarboxylate transporter 1-like [Melanotaenia boesemani]
MTSRKMSGYSQKDGSIGIADYVVFVLMLVVSAGIGAYYAWVDRSKKSSGHYLTAGSKLTALPVSMSLTVSIMSSITVLSNPAEVYRFGAIYGLIGIAYVLSIVITSEIFLPVFYRLGITSIYEYLELRFNRTTRLLGTVIFIFQSTLYAGVCIYGPALALNRVIGMDIWAGITLTACVCTFYCTLGGLKAVVWTDVFQIGIMLSGFLAVIIKAVIVQGGVSTIISDAQQGGRLNFWDFDINPLRRHTFWTLLVGGTAVWSTVHGVIPASVQRYIACKNITHARIAVFINLLGLCSFLACVVFAGLCLYSVYKSCDPLMAGLVSSHDQLIPNLVMEILKDNPGLPGLFFAAVYSGSLSTVSSSINVLAAVTVEDLIKPFTKISEKHLLFISKGLSLFYGIACLAMAGLATIMGEMMQAATVIGGVTGGPLLGLFSLGILCPFANSKGGLSGLVSGLVVSLCVSIGEMICPSPPEMTRPLPLTTEGCNFTIAGGRNWSSTAVPTEHSLFITAPVQNSEDMHSLDGKWHFPSYLYICLIGAVIALTVGMTVSLLTGGRRENVEPRLLLKKEDSAFYNLLKSL